MSTMLTCASMYFMVGVFGYLTFLESVKPTRGPDSSSGDVLTLYKVETDGYDFAMGMVRIAAFNCPLVADLPLSGHLACGIRVITDLFVRESLLLAAC